MAFTVKHKRSDEEGRRPRPESLLDGQLALNFNDETPGVYLKTDKENIIKIGPVHIGEYPPLTSYWNEYSVGEFWISTRDNENILKVWTGNGWMNIDVDRKELEGLSLTVHGSVNSNLIPSGNCIYDLGAPSFRWRDVYACDVFAGDLNLCNESRGGNDVDGTWGSYTIQEGEEDLYLINKRSGKKFRFVLEQVES